MYFKKLPLIYYDLYGTPQYPQIVRDITLRVKLSEFVNNAEFMYERYIIRDGERPDQVADKIYNNSELHWVIMLANNIIDPYFDWPMSDATLEKFILEKYEFSNTPHHYEDSDGYWIDSTVSGSRPVSNYEYEVQENDKKRSIRIVKPELIQMFLSEFDRIIRE